MEPWKRNLYIVWVGCFLTSGGMSMIIPFLPLYVQELGVHDVHKAAMWSAMIFGANHVMIALVSPLWGRLSDTYGQKMMMIRSGIGMGILIIAMGFVTTPLGLLLLRAVFGTVAGFMASATALMAIETPREHAGRVLGTLQTGQVSGQLLGPLFGGIMAETLGMRNSFYVTGILILTATTIAIIGVRESRTYRKFDWFRKNSGGPSREPQKAAQEKQTLGQIIRHTPVLLTIFISTYLVNGSLQSISPIITLYVKSMDIRDHIEIMSGLIFAASALGTIVAAPVLGRFGDRWGHPTVLMVCLFLMAVLNIPQALVHDPWTLLGLRFMSGLCVGGLMPSISSLLRSMTPSGIQGSVFGYNSSASSFGNVSGACLGGLVSSYIGIPYVFYFVSAIFMIHFAMLAFQFKRIDKARKAKATI